jgi:hypothetical protein
MLAISGPFIVLREIQRLPDIQNAQATFSGVNLLGSPIYYLEFAANVGECCHEGFPR